jgi:hypothetical protein
MIDSHNEAEVSFSHRIRGGKRTPPNHDPFSSQGCGKNRRRNQDERTKQLDLQETTPDICADNSTVVGISLSLEKTTPCKKRTAGGRVGEMFHAHAKRVITPNKYSGQHFLKMIDDLRSSYAPHEPHEYGNGRSS